MIIKLTDDIDYESLNQMLKEVKGKVNIVHSGNRLYKIERYLLFALRELEKRKIEFDISRIPPCYIEDFLLYSSDITRFLEQKEAFSEYHYYEDCRFCRLRKICPGALPKYEDQVFASFKEHYDVIDYSSLTPKVYKLKKSIEKLRELFERDEIKSLKLNEQKLLLKNDKDEIINQFFSELAEKKENKDIFYTSLEVQGNTTKLKDTKRYSYRTSDKTRTGKKYLQFLTDVEFADQIVLASESCLSWQMKEFLKPEQMMLVDSVDRSNIELFKLLSHKMTLFIKSTNNFYYISTDPVAVELATGEKEEAEMLSLERLGSKSFKLIEI